MNPSLDRQLARWRAADLLDAATAERIAAFEAARAPAGRLRWPVLAALAAGGLMLVAGTMLFVAAHWGALAPLERFGLLLGMVVAFHGGATGTAHRFPALATTLHAAGTGALGAAIFLAGQVFNLQTGWAGGLMLWALGAWAGWGLLRDWPHATFAALLTPAWLVGEWADRAGPMEALGGAIPAAGLLLLALVYLHAAAHGRSGTARSALVAIGGLAIFPLAVLVSLAGGDSGWWAHGTASRPFVAFWWAVAFGGPLLLAGVLRGREGWLLLVAAVWVLAGIHLGRDPGVLSYLWGAAGAVGLTASGVFESNRLRINLGMAGFALTVVIFYFSSVMDRLGRSASLLVGGALFLGIGWALERVRRGLVDRAAPTEVV